MSDPYQIIEGPDGQEYEFPTGMSDDDISTVMRREYPQGAPAISAEDTLAQKHGFSNHEEAQTYGKGANMKRGATFTLGDEMAGVANMAVQAVKNIPRADEDEIPLIQAFKDGQERDLNAVRWEREARPKRAFGGELMGAMLSGGAGKGLTIMQNAPKRAAAVVGAGYGSQETGIGNADATLKDRAIGAGIAAALAPAVLVLGKGGAAIISGTVGKLLGRKTNFTTKQLKARELIVDASVKTGKTREEVVAIINDLATNGGNEELLFQRLGLVDEARGFAANKSDAQRFASDQVFKAKGKQRGELADVMKTAISDQDFDVLKNGITSRLKEASGLYNDVLSQPVAETVKLTSLRKDPFYKRAARDAKQIAKSEKLRDGMVGEARHLQLVKEGLDDLVTKYLRKKPKYARAAMRVRADLLSEMDAQLSGFKEVRALWGGDVANKNALQLGREFLRHEPRDLRDLVARMSESEKRHHLAGMLDALSKKISIKADGADLTRIVNERVREQLAAILPEEQANHFYRGFAGQAKKRSELNSVDPFSGSQTQPRQTAAENARLSTIPRGRKFAADTATLSGEVAYNPFVQPGRVLKYIGSRAAREDPDVLHVVTRMLFSSTDEAGRMFKQLNAKQKLKVKQYFKSIWPQQSGVIAGVVPDETRSKIGR